MNKLKFIGILVLLALVGHYVWKQYTTANPFDQVEWIEDRPGATGRYVTFTPILKSSKFPIGPTVGADYAVLTFKDLDGDGIKEAIIETEESIHLEFYSHERHVLKFESDEVAGPKFRYAEESELKEH